MPPLAIPKRSPNGPFASKKPCRSWLNGPKTSESSGLGALLLEQLGELMANIDVRKMKMMIIIVIVISYSQSYIYIHIYITIIINDDDGGGGDND